MLAEAAAGAVPTSTGGDEIENWMLGVRVKTVAEFEDTLGHATERVHRQKKGMLIEVLM